MKQKRYPLQNARTVYIPSQKNTIALSVLESHPQAVTVLFYPGTMASPYMYSLFLEELQAVGCNVVGIHPLSHGLSPRKKILFTFDDIVRNGQDAQAWAAHHFSGPLVVCGHSQGGIVALAHALSDSRKNSLTSTTNSTADTPSLAACFSLGTLLPHAHDAVNVTRFKAFLRHKDSILRGIRFFSHLFPFLPIPFWLYLQPKKIFAHAYKVFAPAKGIRLWYPLIFISSLFHKDLQHVQQHGHMHCPFFLLSAKNDALFSWPLMQKIFESIRAPQKKLIPIAGGGHLCAVSRLYAKHMAAIIAAECAGLGLPIYINHKN